MGLMKNSRHALIFVLLASIAGVVYATTTFADIQPESKNDTLVELGKVLFNSPSLSRDGKIACASCHVPEHAYADPHPLAIGIDGKRGTRNAPSLVGIADDAAFFWDGRRTQLNEVVLDPITNPAELGWPSANALLDKLRSNPSLAKRFEEAFPRAKEPLSSQNLASALSTFIRSLRTGTSVFDQASSKREPLPSQAELGRKLFAGVARCNECHRIDDAKARLTDNQYHHSGIGGATQSRNLSQLSQAVVVQNLDANALGHKVLTDPEWSALGRFTFSHQPSDIGAFRTPSLRNVAITAPYMHDGSIATLAKAVDHEVYYRGFSNGRPINLSEAERHALVTFLETLTDAEYQMTEARK